MISYSCKYIRSGISGLAVFRPDISAGFGRLADFGRLAVFWPAGFIVSAVWPLFNRLFGHFNRFRARIRTIRSSFFVLD